MRSSVLFIIVPAMVIALSALAASPSVALESVWLANGVKPAVKRASIAQGGSLEYEYAEFMGTKIKVEVSCIMFWRGLIAGNKTVSNAKLDEVEEVLSINERLPLECHFVEEGPCERKRSHHDSGEPALVDRNSIKRD